MPRTDGRCSSGPLRRPVGGPRRRGHVAADRHRAGRTDVAAVRGPLADACAIWRRRGRTICSPRGPAWATTGEPCRCATRPGRSSRTTRGGCRRRSQSSRRCPGIGPYTARAVAAAAFGVPVAPLDVNVRRVVSRVLGVAASSPGLQAEADDLVSRAEPGRWFDAVMDLASGTCLPRAPSVRCLSARRPCARRAAWS